MANKKAAHAPHDATHESESRPTGHPERAERSKRAEWHSHFQNLLRSERAWGIAFCTIFLAIALAFTIDVRLQTVNMDMADDWARSTLDQNGQNYMGQLIRQQYPTLPDTQVQTEAARRWNDYKKTNAAELKAQQDAIAAQLRDNYQFTTADGTQQTYIFEMDPYLWWQMAYNVATHDSACEPGSGVFPNGNCRDAKRLAPIGTEQAPTFHVLVQSALITMFHDPADPALDSLRPVFFLPVILMFLATIPAFFLGRRLAGNIGGFAASVLIAAHPIILNRTVAGWADTDPYAIIFPLFMLLFAIEAFRAERWWTRTLFTALAAFATALYASSWGGWWFSFFVIIVCMAAYLFYDVAFIAWRTRSLKPKIYTELVPGVAVTTSYLVFSAIFVTLIASWRSFIGAFLAPFQLSTGLQAATADSAAGWPNILTTVAELNIPGLPAIIQQFGSVYGNGAIWVVTIAAFGLFALLLDPRRMTWKTWALAILVFVYYATLLHKGLGLATIPFMVLFALPLLCAVGYIFFRSLSVDLRASVFIMGWLLATLFAATQGVRFILLGVPAFGIAFGVAVGWIFVALSENLIALWKRPLLTRGVVGALLLFLVFNPVAAYDPIERAYQAGKQQAPGMNDAWWETMRVLREDTPTDTIVTSWWDFGHWFRNLGNRSVTFDGGSQNPQPGHWVGKALLTSSEVEALGIIRMFNCGQNTAYDVAHETLDVIPAKKLINEIILLSREEARERLAQTTIPLADQERILAVTHCEPRPQVFITSGDMIGKAGVWGHFGSWSFERSMAYIYSQKYPQNEAIARLEASGLDKTTATSLYAEARALPSALAANSWISGWPNYLTQNWIGCTVENNTVRCRTTFGYQQTQQGVVAVDGIAFRPDAPEDTAITIGVYNNGARLGEVVTRPPKIAFLARDADELMTFRTSQDRTPAGLFVPSILIRESGTPGASRYDVLFADELQVDSLFTQLYFLDGATTPRFTKKATNVEVGGGVITVWNVELLRD
jgi:dolichyl-diphosphooligosaccharide--protein glycosyltransferase